jgi:hypothetical protein
MTARPEASNVDDPVLVPAEPGSGRRPGRRPWRRGADRPRWRPPAWLDASLRAAGGVAVALVAVEAAVVECFLVPLRLGTLPVPLAAAAAVAGNILLARLMVAVTGRRPTALLPPVLWLVVVLVFAAPRAEGDLVVPGTWPGLVFLFLGAIAGAFGAATSITPRQRLPRPGSVGDSGKVPPRG